MKMDLGAMFAKKMSIISIEEYGNKWLHDERFEASLEEDNIDESIVETEVAILKDEWQRKTKRKKLVKVLQSNPAQIAVSILVLIDVLLMVALLLIDVHVLKDKMEAKGVQISQVVEFLKGEYHTELANYTGDDIGKILDIIQNQGSQSSHVNNHRKRSTDYLYAMYKDNSDSYGGLYEVLTKKGTSGSWISRSSDDKNNKNAEKYNNLHNDHASLLNSNARVRRLRSSERGAHSKDSVVAGGGGSVGDNTHDVSSTHNTTEAHNSTGHGDDHHDSDHTMEHLSHIFHISSIVILGIMVSEVFFKMAVMGKKFFDWKDGKLEIMDAIVVCVSFTLDLIFYKGIFATGISEATTLLLIFLIWRMIQVFNGVISTTKRRLEFRIRLQKKARRQAEEKLVNKEEQNQLLQEEIKNLHALCRYHKITEEDIVNCKPIVSARGRCNSTSMAVSSIMRMSVGFIRHLSRAETGTTSQDSGDMPISPTSSVEGSFEENGVALKPAESMIGSKSPRVVHKMDTLREDNSDDDESRKSDYGSDTSDDGGEDARRKRPHDSGIGSSMEGSEKPDDTPRVEQTHDNDVDGHVISEIPLSRSQSEKGGRKPDCKPLLRGRGSEKAKTSNKSFKRPSWFNENQCSLSCTNLAERDHLTTSNVPEKLSISVGNNLNKKVTIVDNDSPKFRGSLKRQKSFDDNTTAIQVKPNVINGADDKNVIKMNNVDRAEKSDKMTAL